MEEDIADDVWGVCDWVLLVEQIPGQRRVWFGELDRVELGRGRPASQVGDDQLNSPYSDRT